MTCCAMFQDDPHCPTGLFAKHLVRNVCG